MKRAHCHIQLVPKTYCSFTFLNGNYKCLKITEGKEFPLKRVSCDTKRNPDETARKKNPCLSVPMKDLRWSFSVVS